MKPVQVRREHTTNGIAVTSYGAFSTGSNIRRILYVVLGFPSKSRYRVLQTIGRGLRRHASKRVLHAMDIVDDLRIPKIIKGKPGIRANYALRHWTMRHKFYREESFPVEMYSHEITR